MLDKFVENCLPWEGPHTGAGEECEDFSPKEEGAAETVCDELTVTLIPRPPVLPGGRRERNGSEGEPRRRERSWEGVLRSGFLSHYPTLICDELNSLYLPKFSMFHP